MFRRQCQRADLGLWQGSLCLLALDWSHQAQCRFTYCLASLSVAYQDNLHYWKLQVVLDDEPTQLQTNGGR
jgi:hypothetical protein